MAAIDCFSNTLAITGVTLCCDTLLYILVIPLRVEGDIRSFPRRWPALGSNGSFQILVISGVNISGWSLQTQCGIMSGPVAVFLSTFREFHTCLCDFWNLNLAVDLTWY